MLLSKTLPVSDVTSPAFLLGILELRNTGGETGRSPAEIVFGRPTRSCMHAVQQKGYYDVATASHQPIPLFSKVRVQDNSTRLWPVSGKVIRAIRRRYLVRLDDGRLFWRNRRLIKPLY
eukprot:maker-scaffold112_size353035-snap-gene-2.37 protein:Tk07410 transcript:maker-scaffold112_size353035-snap-gene-2.37-mRNA-1 annotation:"hypothetical protein DAPPUDRAFT_256239"